MIFDFRHNIKLSQLDNRFTQQDSKFAETASQLTSLTGDLKSCKNKIALQNTQLIEHARKADVFEKKWEETNKQVATLLQVSCQIESVILLS